MLDTTGNMRGVVGLLMDREVERYARMAASTSGLRERLRQTVKKFFRMIDIGVSEVVKRGNTFKGKVKLNFRDFFKDLYEYLCYDLSRKMKKLYHFGATGYPVEPISGNRP